MVRSTGVQWGMARELMILCTIPAQDQEGKGATDSRLMSHGHRARRHHILR